MFAPTDENVLKVLNSIESAKNKLNELQELCQHENISLNDWKDTWNGWDYPCYSTGVEHFQCTKCGLVTTVESVIAHGIRR